MAKCDQGYLCEVCAEPVPNIIDSSLYLRYVLGEVEINELFGAPERHLRCDPELAQYIVHEKFPRPETLSTSNQTDSDDAVRMMREKQVTAGWLRLREVVGSGIPITEYPIPSREN